MAFSHEAHKALITDFLDALDENRLPAVHGREALKVQLLIEALLRSGAERCAANVAWDGAQRSFPSRSPAGQILNIGTPMAPNPRYAGLTAYMSSCHPAAVSGNLAIVLRTAIW